MKIPEVIQLLRTGVPQKREYQHSEPESCENLVEMHYSASSQTSRKFHTNVSVVKRLSLPNHTNSQNCLIFYTKKYVEEIFYTKKYFEVFSKPNTNE